MEYLLVVDGVQENLISIMANGGTCAPLTDSANYANRQWILDSGNVTNNYGQCGTTCVAPVITLTGGDETITVGDAYTDAGATASDDEQGDISANISGITDLDTSVAGVYTVAYNVSDGALNAATEVVRTVTVEAAGACDGATALTIGTQQCGNTNEFGDLFDDSACLGNYDGGDDYIFSYTATTTGDKLDLTITGQLGYTGFAMSQGCPEGGAGTCVGVQTSSGSGALNFESDALIAGEVYYIQISTWPTPQSTDFCLDAVLVPAPSCLAPANFEAAAVTSTSANLTWTASASNETAWNIEYGADGFTQGDGSGTTVAVTANPYAFTALTANTSYDVYLQANCGAGDTSVWVGPLSFTTLCATEIPDYTQGFDIFTGICWTEATGPIAGPTAGTTTSVWFQDEFANTDALGQSAGINIYGTGGESWLISPTFDLSSGGYEINLDAALTAYGATTTGELNGDDVVHVMQSLDEGSTWSSIYTWDATNMPSNVGDNVTIDVSAVTSATVKFALFAFEDTSANGDFDFFIDNFAVRTPPSCFAPAANSMAVSLITTTSANLSWTAGATETAWNIEYGATGFALGAGSTVAVTANSFPYVGLTANTSYDFYVQADCGGNGTSAWVGPFTFTTLCDAVTTFPWTEDFEGITGLSLPSCWSENDNNADADYWQIYTGFGTSDSNSVGMYTDYNAGANDDYLILPQFVLTGNERLKFSVRSRTSGEPNDYKVVLSTSSNDPTDFTTELMALTAATVTHTEQVIDLSAYSGNVYIAIHVPAEGLDGYFLYVDDFTVEALPSCLEVTDLAVTNLTNISADLSWTAGATEAAWNLEYGATDFTLGAGTTVAVTANSYALMGLTANTSYDFYVQSDCGANGTSVMVGPFTFATPCSAFTVPYFEGFETGYTHAMPVDGCLVQESSIGTAVWNANNTYTSYNRTPRTGDWNAYVGYNNTDWLFVYIDLIADTSYTASVYARQDGSTATNSDITISYGTSAGASAMTNSIVPATGIINGDYQLISGAFTPATSGTFVIGIKGYMNGSPYYISLDDISIDLSPSCLAVTGLSASNLTTTSADLSWTAGATETAWEYQVVEAETPPAETGTTTSDNPLVLTGLSSTTEYDFYVRANCGADGTSEWVMVSFTTLPDPIVPEYANDFSTFPGEFWMQAEGALADGPSGITSGWGEDGFLNEGTTGSARLNIYTSSWSPSEDNDWLLSPQFDLSTGDFFLNMDVAVTAYSGSGQSAMGSDDSVTVVITDDNGVNWSTLYVWNADNAPANEATPMPEVDLASYNGLVRIGILGSNGAVADSEDFNFYVDNFSVTSTSLGIDTVSKSNFTYFPNPVNNVLSIKAQASIDSITVYNMLGQTVVRSTPNTTTTTVDMSGLQTGAYFVQVAINNSIETVRVIKN